MRSHLLTLLALAVALSGCSPAPTSTNLPAARPAADRSARPTSYSDREDRDRATDDNPATSQGGRRRTPRARPATGATPGQFDFYLLTLSWSPEFCTTHPSATECTSHPGFILHGLWPQNTDGTYPEDCSSAPGPANPAQYSDIYPDPSLLQHEWATHGTCSGLGPDAFFQLARQAFQSIHTPAALNSLTAQTSEPPATILGQFAAINPNIPQPDFALSCGNNFLTAVQACLDKNLSAFSCQIRTCAANTVRIVPRGSSN